MKATKATETTQCGDCGRMIEVGESEIIIQAAYEANGGAVATGHRHRACWRRNERLIRAAA